MVEDLYYEKDGLAEKPPRWSVASMG